VPATSFCEPNGDAKPATWHWFSVKGTEPRPAHCFSRHLATLERPDDEKRANVEIDTYAFLTTTPNSLVANQRMPVLLTREEKFETWLHGLADEAFALACEYPPG